MTLDPQTSAFLKDVALGQLRHYLGMAGTALASYGVIGADPASQTQFITVAIGIVLAVAGPALSWLEKTGVPEAQARMVGMMAAAEARKTAAAQQWAAAEAAKKALAASLGTVPPAAPQPHEGH
jgi:hypothetical protein